MVRKMPKDPFQQSTRAQDSSAPSVSTIGGDLKITGNVTSKGEIHLDGHVHGDVHCVALILGENSNVEGNVTAEDVVVRGRLIGSVQALRVTLQSESHVEGDLSHQSLAIEQGAFFDGWSRPSEDPLSTSQTIAEDLAAVKSPVVHSPQERKDKPAAAFMRSLPGSD
jgi:cytoskeletal protein CcmA (bactofilin family)